MIIKIFLLSFFISFSLCAQVSEKLKSPRDTMRTFMIAMEKVKKGDARAINDAMTTLDLIRIDPSLRNLVGKVSSERLVNTIDRIAKINYATIPNFQNGPAWIFRKQTVSLNDKIFEVEISISKSADGNWKFTPETIFSSENFYTSVAHLKVVDGVDELTNWRTRIKSYMPAWMGEEYILFKTGQWIAIMLLLFLSIIIATITRSIIRLYVSKKSKEATLPFGILAVSLTFLVGVRFLEFDVEALAVFVRISYILTSFSAVWSALHLVDYISYRFEKPSALSKYKFDDVLIPLLKKGAKVLVVAFGAILIAHSLTFDIASILAGLGIGGVAVAFAAKDTIANIFGSLTVIIDRPFFIGDYVVLEKGIEGSIEQVGFRSTRLRTPYNSLVTVPNSVLANMSIDNYGMRKFRRFKTILNLAVDTPLDNLEIFCNKLREEIHINPIMLEDKGQIYVHDISESSIQILVNVFFQTSSASVELEERQKFIFIIMKNASDLQIKIARPQYI